MRYIYTAIITILIFSLIGCGHNFKSSQVSPISYGHMTSSSSDSSGGEEGRKGSEEAKEKKINGELVILGIILTIAGAGLWANGNKEENEEDRGMYRTLGTIGFCAGIPMTLFGLIPQ